MTFIIRAIGTISSSVESRISDLENQSNVLGISDTYAALLTDVSGKTPKVGDFGRLTADDIGTGDAVNPQYPAGWYTWDGTTLIFDSGLTDASTAILTIDEVDQDNNPLTTTGIIRIVRYPDGGEIIEVVSSTGNTITIG